MTATNPAFIYTDFNSFSRLKETARTQSPQALQEAAKQFEALFVQRMLKSMRAASLGDGGLLDSEQSHFYRELFDQQLALTLAQHSGLGLAKSIIQQLDSRGGMPPPVAKPGPVNTLATLRRAAHTQAHPQAGGSRSTVAKRSAADTPSTEHSSAPSLQSVEIKPTSPEAFVRHLWSPAQHAARRLGVAPQVLIAQAALESNWGKSVPRSANGQSSHNLFGIKADRRWQGERISNSTLEFIHGIPQQRCASFRAYSSYAASFTDYVNFLGSNPRYADALRQAGDSAAYVRALHRAGYATDPHYSNKILRILYGDTLNRALSGLKSAANWPISSV